MIDNSAIRTRIAPSPTGLFHLGNARAALFNWLFAKKNDGKFILRIEDTDKVRSKPEYEIDITEGLTWLGLGWDEGPETPDLFGPYRQSERGQIYQKYIQKLLEDGLAYYCYCSEEELAAERQAQEDKKEAPKYSGRCRDLSEDKITQLKKEGRKPTIRFKTPLNQKIKFKDLVHGPMEFDSNLIGDFIIVKSNGDPIFLISNIIDDAQMQITHCLRGDDHLSNTPKQLMLAEAMNLTAPDYGHLPLILNPDRTKLSKRKNPTSLTRDFRDKGYLPEAMINFLVFLGWTPARQASQLAGVAGGPKIKQEFFTLDELIAEFNLSDVGKSPAVFDQAKLDFINGYYIRQMPLGELANRCLPYLEKAGLVKINQKTDSAGLKDEMVLSAIGLIQERMKHLSEAPALTAFFFQKPTYESSLLIAKKSDKVKTLKGLEESWKVLSEEDDFSRDSIEQLLRALAEKINLSAGEILWPIRVALSGQPASPGVFELVEVFGKAETLARIKTAIDMLK